MSARMASAVRGGGVGANALWRGGGQREGLQEREAGSIPVSADLRADEAALDEEGENTFQ